jgi:O-antigen/teichoic acid export membrane protein
MTAREPRIESNSVAGDFAGGPKTTDDSDATTRRTAQNAAIMVLCEIAGKLATLLFTVVAARGLGPAEFGAFAYAMSFSLLVAVLPAWGFDPLLVQRGSAEPGRLSVLLSETLVWRVALAIPIFIVASIIGVSLRPTARSAISLLVILAATFLDTFIEAGRSVARARQSQAGIGKALLAQRFSTAALAIGAVWVGFGLIGISLTYLFGTVVGGITVVRSLRQLGVRADFTSLKREGLALTGRLSVAVGIESVLGLVLFRIDQLMLGAFKGDEAVGQYAAGYRLLETVLFVSWSVALAVFPVMSAGADRLEIRRRLEQGLAAIFVLYVPFAVILWIEGEAVLRLLFGVTFAVHGAPVLHWLSSAPLFFAIAFLGTFALLATQRQGRVVIVTLTATAYNIGLNLVLIPRLSGTGAAIATTTSYALEAVLVLAFLIPAVGVVRLHRSVTLPALSAIIMSVMLLAVHQTVLVELSLALFTYGLVWITLTRWRAPEQLAVMLAVLRWHR